MTKITNELIRAYIDNGRYFEASIAGRVDRIKQLKADLAHEEAGLTFCRDALRLAQNCEMIDGVAVKIDGYWVETVAEDDKGSTYRAAIYEKAGTPGEFAVRINEVNHHFWHAPPFRWNGGNVMGLGCNWDFEEAKAKAIDWVVHQKTDDAIFKAA